MADGGCWLLLLVELSRELRQMDFLGSGSEYLQRTAETLGWKLISSLMLVNSTVEHGSEIFNLVFETMLNMMRLCLCFDVFPCYCCRHATELEVEYKLWNGSWRWSALFPCQPVVDIFFVLLLTQHFFPEFGIVKLLRSFWWKSCAPVHLKGTQNLPNIRQRCLCPSLLEDANWCVMAIQSAISCRASAHILDDWWE